MKKTFKKFKGFACRSIAVIVLLIAGILASCGLGFVAMKLLMALGMSTFAAALLVSGAFMGLSASTGWFFSRHTELASKMYKWVHNFTHWNDEIYIVA